ncbi:MAG TPA: hypothetical protein VG711_03975, partial [Phycisphaerales bacterium]|nr:hypothetical protein [Phycisphaerales bacterium]
LKLIDVAAWTLRYVAAFAIIDRHLSWDSALCLACAGTLANSIPFIGNGLGIREWTIALLSPLLADSPAQWGVTAELINRAVELLVIIPAGSAGFLVLAHFTARWKSRLRESPGT